MIGSTDAEVIAESLDDPARFGEIFDRHAQPIFRFLGRRIGADNADDVLGDVFVTAFDHRRRYDVQRSSALPWLYGIATNLLEHHRRREARRMRATARLRGRRSAAEDPADLVAEAILALTR